MRDFVSRQAVKEITQRLPPSDGRRRDIVGPAMMELVIGSAAVVLVAWFAGGTIFNVKRGRAVMRWMHSGLPMLGERTTVRWLGSTAVEMTIREGKAPFATLTLIIFLEPRDLPWMWALAHAQGRRDTLIIRGSLRRPPQEEFEALARASWSEREVSARLPKEWPVRNGGPIAVHHASGGALRKADVLLSIGEAAVRRIWRLSVRRTEPHFQLHVALPDCRGSARDFFDAVGRMAEGAAA
jgi:hypothetical protein